MEKKERREDSKQKPFRKHIYLKSFHTKCNYVSSTDNTKINNLLYIANYMHQCTFCFSKRDNSYIYSEGKPFSLCLTYPHIHDECDKSW